MSVVAQRMLTAVALIVGSALAVTVLVAGGVLVRPGEVRDVGDGVSMVAYPVVGIDADPRGVVLTPGGEVIVAHLSGEIAVFAGGQPEPQLLATSTVPDVRSGDVAGLLGLSIDPDFENTRSLYACASRDADGAAGPAPWQNQLLRLHVAADWRITVDEVLVDELSLARERRNGCVLATSSDRRLWVATGDGGLPRRAANPRRAEGKVLRLEAGGGVPDDNPRLVENRRRTHIYATGLRDPWAIAIGPDGTAYVADRGPQGDDELNRVVAGADYGWPCVLGARPNPDAPAGLCNANAVSSEPAWATGAEAVGVRAIVQLAGSGWERWAGDLLVAGQLSRDLQRLEIAGDRLTTADVLFATAGWTPGPAALGPDGILYVAVTRGGNASIMRVEPSS